AHSTRGGGPRRDDVPDEPAVAVVERGGRLIEVAGAGLDGLVRAEDGDGQRGDGRVEQVVPGLERLKPGQQVQRVGGGGRASGQLRQYPVQVLHLARRAPLLVAGTGPAQV